MTIKPNSAELHRLLKGSTSAEVAKVLSVSVRTISRWRAEYGLGYEYVHYSDYPPLSDTQKEIMTACLLGDGCIDRRQNRFRFGQTESKMKYVQWIFKSLLPYSSCIKLNDGHGSSKPSWRMCTTSNSLFKELRNKWYVNRSKVVPKDIILTPFILANWVVQGGSNNQGKRSFRISTESFAEADVLLLIEILERDLGIAATLNFKLGKPVIHVGAYQYFQFIEIIKPYITWDCFKYKTDTSLVKNKTNNNLGSCKLNVQLAKEIRYLFREGASVIDLSKMFVVTIRSIYNIVNNVTYREKETAEVNVVYNHIADSGASGG